jgi:hypothetical protein
MVSHWKGISLLIHVKSPSFLKVATILQFNHHVPATDLIFDPYFWHSVRHNMAINTPEGIGDHKLNLCMRLGFTKF